MPIGRGMMDKMWSIYTLGLYSATTCHVSPPGAVSRTGKSTQRRVTSAGAGVLSPGAALSGQLKYSKATSWGRLPWPVFLLKVSEL